MPTYGYSATGAARDANNPANTQYTDQPEDVSSEVNRITSAGGPLMRQAAAAGAASQARRGLLNSSMATGAAQQAVYNTALPMAQQNMAQNAARNLSAQNYGQQRSLQGEQLAMQHTIATEGNTSSERINERRVSADEGMNTARIGSEERMNTARIGSQETLAREGMHSSELIAQRNNDLQRDMQRENMHSSELIAQSDRSSREAIANMQVSSNDRERIASYLAAMENSYAGLFNGIQNNQNIPAETRQEYLSHAAAIRNSTLAMAQQVYGAAAQGVSWASPRV